MTMLEDRTASTEPDVDYLLSDADQHYYEAPDCLTRHLEKKHQSVVKWVEMAGNRKTVMIHGKQLTVVPNPTYNPVGVPGCLEPYFRAQNHEGRELRDIVTMAPIMPEAQNRDLRKQRLDEFGVDLAWLIPSMGLGVEEMLQEDPESGMAIFTAYNRWLDEDWGYDRGDGLLTGPMISFMDATKAEAELDRVMEIGVRMIIMRAGPVATPFGRGPSPADPMFDRIWAKCAEAGVVVAIHAGDAGYTKFMGDWGEATRYTGMKQSPLTEVLSVGIERPIFDMMAALICHGLFNRHPKLKVATLELGSAWVPELHRRLRASYGKTPQLFDWKDPVESFREHVWVAPFYEDSIPRLAELHGHDRILLGSDWPHPEGLATPRKWIKDFVGLGPDNMRKALRDNQRELCGLPL